ncbi:MAG: gamma-butyrobetaine hydroxylase-like domain-containing protein [Pseudomonadota bacterium]
MAGAPWPTEITISKARDSMRIVFDDGAEAGLSAEYLRVFTPSAERVGHGGGRMVIGGKRAVTIKDVSAVGQYAIRIAFDDGHDTGIYPLSSLFELADQRSEGWQNYLEELETLGLTRDTPGTQPAPKSLPKAADPQHGGAAKA